MIYNYFQKPSEIIWIKMGTCGIIFLMARFCCLSGISCSTKKVTLSYLKSLKNGWFLQRHFSNHLFASKKYLKESVFPVVMLLHWWVNYCVVVVFFFFRSQPLIIIKIYTFIFFICQYRQVALVKHNQ